MDSNLSYFSLPFVDPADLDFGKIRGQDCEYDDLHPTLPSHGSLLGADDVLAQFLSGDDPLEEPDLNGPTTLHCEICRKQFDNAKKYYGHLRVHSKDNLWICDKCPNEKFSTKQQLMKHSLTHQPLERVWRCPQCEMSFEALWRLQQHLFAKHLDYRPHKCDVCQKAFHKLSDLDKHKDIHEDIKKHACSVCNRKFTDKSNLKRHMLTHKSEKHYPCSRCGHRFKQIASMRRHCQNCPMVQNNPTEAKKSYRNNYCRVCGLTFQYKSSLLEHCVREHSNNPTQPPPEPPKEDKSNQLHVDTNRTVDKIVDDILSAEDDYMTMSTQNELINNYPTEVNQDNLMQIELLKEINQMNNIHDILDDELLYNDIDIDTFQTMYNMDYERNELFDLNDGRSMDQIMNGKTLDQDIMNAIRGIDQNVPKEFLNTTEINKVNEFFVPPVSVNECSTIFESDVDLEASTNLAANLNQLIGENSVQYISTEHDDTFIISLNSEIDAEQLTDMLNIGVENKPFKTEIVPESKKTVEGDKELGNSEAPVEKIKKKTRIKVMYVCLKCKKIFKTKTNYTSHRGTHDPDLQQYKCGVCSERFSYKSSLNKHMMKMHIPTVKTAHTCPICEKNYSSAWQLKQHTEQNHSLLQPYQCEYKDCGKKYYRRWDFIVHSRVHSGEKPYNCNICSRGFKTPSQLARHVKLVHCTKTIKKEIDAKNPKLTGSLGVDTPQDAKRKVKTQSSITDIDVAPQKSKIEGNKRKRLKPSKSLILTPQNLKIESIAQKPVDSDLLSNQNLNIKPNNTPSTKRTNSKAHSEENKPKRPKIAKSLLLTPRNSKMELCNAQEPLISSIVTPQDLKIRENKPKIPKNSKSLLLTPQNLKMEQIKTSINGNLVTQQKLNIENITKPVNSLLLIPQNFKMEQNKTPNSGNLVIPQNIEIRPKPHNNLLLAHQNLNIDEIKTSETGNLVTLQKLNTENRPMPVSVLLTPQNFQMEPIKTSKCDNIVTSQELNTENRPKPVNNFLLTPQNLKMEQIKTSKCGNIVTPQKLNTENRPKPVNSLLLTPQNLKMEQIKTSKSGNLVTQQKLNIENVPKPVNSLVLIPQNLKKEQIITSKRGNFVTPQKLNIKNKPKPVNSLLLTPQNLKMERIQTSKIGNIVTPQKLNIENVPKAVNSLLLTPRNLKMEQIKTSKSGSSPQILKIEAFKPQVSKSNNLVTTPKSKIELIKDEKTKKANMMTPQHLKIDNNKPMGPQILLIPLNSKIGVNNQGAANNGFVKSQDLRITVNPLTPKSRSLLIPA